MFSCPGNLCIKRKSVKSDRMKVMQPDAHRHRLDLGHLSGIEYTVCTTRHNLVKYITDQTITVSRTAHPPIRDSAIRRPDIESKDEPSPPPLVWLSFKHATVPLWVHLREDDEIKALKRTCAAHAVKATRTDPLHRFLCLCKKYGQLLINSKIN